MLRKLLLMLHVETNLNKVASRLSTYYTIYSFLCFAQAAEKKRNAADPLGQWLIKSQSSINHTRSIHALQKAVQKIPTRHSTLTIV